MKQILTDEEVHEIHTKVADKYKRLLTIDNAKICGNTTFLTEQAIIKKIEKEIDRKKQWHKGECRGFPDCSICLFLKELQSLFKNNKEMM